MKKYIIGVDGGNSKTDYLLFDVEGNFKYYYCDICRDKIVEKDKCMGLYFTTDRKFEVRTYNECNHHICKYCAESLKKIFGNKGE